MDHSNPKPIDTDTGFFCNLPFSSIIIHDDGMATPCCYYHPNTPQPISKYLNSPEIQEVQQTLLAGRAPPQCHVCVEQERDNGHSFRIINQQFHPHLTREIVENNSRNIREVSITTSNVCNLKCLPCARASFVRTVELNRLGLDTYPAELIENKNYQDWLTVFENNQVEQLTLLGGEPFYDKITFEFLKLLADKGLSRNLRVDLNTNMTAIDDSKLDFLQSNFKTVLIKASIDGVGAVNDYLRYPSRWSDIEANVNKCLARGLEFVVTTALTNLSLLRYHEVVRWGNHHGFNLFITPATSPFELVPALLPSPIRAQLLSVYQKLKQDIIETARDRTLLCVDSCIHILSTTQSTEANWKQTMSWIKLHDQHRKNSVTAVFPELVDYLDNDV